MRTNNSKNNCSTARRATSLLTAILYTFTLIFGPGSNAWAGMADFLRPRENEEIKNTGQYSPLELQKQMRRKRSVFQSQNKTEKLLNLQLSKGPDALKSRIEKNAQESIKSAQELTQQAEKVKNRTAAALGEKTMFNYVKYDDGKTVWFQNGLAKRTENERILDTQGNVSLRNTSNMEYNDKRLLTSYTSETTDALGSVSRIQWYGAQYTEGSVFYASDDTKANKLITGYTQETTDHFGNTTKVEWANGSYDQEGRLSSYHEVTTDFSDNRTTKDWSGARYDSNRQITEFTETVSDSLGNRQIRHWSGATYVKNPGFSDDLKSKGVDQEAPEFLVTGYHEEITDAFGQTSARQYRNAVHDKNGNLSSYEETLTDSAGHSTLHFWFGARYDRYNRLMAYEEIWSSQDIEAGSSPFLQSTAWKAESYDIYGNLLGYSEETASPSGDVLRYTETDAQYDSKYRKVAYFASSEDADGNQSHTIRADTRYDPKGRLTDSIEYSFSDTAPEIIITQTVKGRTYDKNGRAVSGEERTLTRGQSNGNSVSAETTRTIKNAVVEEGSVTAYTEETVTSGTGPTGEILDSKEIVSVSEITPFSEKQMTRRTAPDLDHVVTVQRTGIRRDFFGRSSGYKDTVLDEALSGGESVTERFQTAYGSHGETIGYREKETDLTGLSSEKTVSGIAYNGQDQALSFTQTVFSGQQVTTTRRIRTSYDLLGRADHTCEATATSEQGTIRENEWRALGFNGAGLVSSDETTAGFTSGYTVTTQRGSIGYNRFGQTLRFNETSFDSRTSGLETERSVSGLSYDSLGAVSMQDETIRTVGETINFTTRIIKDQAVYDDRGRLVSCRDMTEKTGEGLEQTETKVRSAMIYDAQNRMLSYQDTAISSDAPDLKTVTQRSDMCYDGLGRLFGYQESTELSDAEGELKTVRTVRERTTYSPGGQATGYLETSSDSSQPSSSTKIEWNGQYDAQDRLYSFSETRERQDTETVQSRSMTLYDSLGQIVRTEDTYTASAEPDVIKTVTVSGMTYNRNGQMTGGRTETHRRSQDGSLDEIVTDIEEDILYDLQGRVTGTVHEEIKKSESGKTARIERTDTRYNGLGQTVSYKETAVQDGGRQLHTETSVSRNGIQYDRCMRMNSYNETVESEPGKTERTWTADGFNGKGELSGWTEQGTSPTGSFLKQTTDVKYDAAGRQVSFRESSTQEGKGTAQRTWNNAEYDGKGQIIAYQEDGADPETGTYQKTWKADFKDAYNTAGQLVHYNETLASGSKTTVRDWVNGAYNALGLLTRYEESSSVRAAGVPEQNISKAWQASFDDSYDSLGRLTHYEENAVTDGTEASNIVWKNAVYDDRGLLNRFEQNAARKAIDKNGNTVLETDSSLVRQEMRYDAFGRLCGYTETGSSPSSGDFENEWRAESFSADGMVDGYHETGFSEANGPYDTVRSMIQYDQSGRTVSYREESISNGQFARKDWEAGRYDALGRILGWNESGWNDSGRYEKTRTSTVYNNLSQTVAYTETGLDTAQGNYEKTWNNAFYDSAERLISYHQKTDSALGTSVICDWKAEQGYNSKGQLLGTVETGQRSENGLLLETTENRWNAGFFDSYGSRGQISRYLSVDNQKDAVSGVETATTRERSRTSYSTDSRLNGYEENIRTVTNSAEGSRTSSIQTIRMETTYYTSDDEEKDASHVRGMVSGTNEKITQSAGPTQQVITTGINYDTDGRIKESTVSTAETELLTGPHTLDSVIRYAEGLFSELMDAAAALLRTVLEQFGVRSADVKRKTDIVYDGRNRAVSWTETAIQSGATAKRTESAVSVTYAGSSQNQETYSARIRETGSDGGNKPLDKTTHVFRTAFTYDSINRAVAYAEMTFEGDLLTIDGETVDWDRLTVQKKNGLLQEIAAGTREVKELTSINRYDKVRYDNSDRMTSYDLVTLKKGFLIQDCAELEGISSTLKAYQDAVTSQREQIADGEKALAAARTEWMSACAKAAESLGIGLPDLSDPEQAMQTFTSIMEEKIGEESQKESEVDQAQELSDAKTAALSKLSAELSESERNLEETRKSWEQSVERFNGTLDSFSSEFKETEIRISALEKAGAAADSLSNTFKNLMNATALFKESEQTPESINEAASRISRLTDDLIQEFGSIQSKAESDLTGSEKNFKSKSDVYVKTDAAYQTADASYQQALTAFNGLQDQYDSVAEQLDYWRSLKQDITEDYTSRLKTTNEQLASMRRNRWLMNITLNNGNTYRMRISPDGNNAEVTCSAYNGIDTGASWKMVYHNSIYKEAEKYLNSYTADNLGNSFSRPIEFENLVRDSVSLRNLLDPNSIDYDSRLAKADRMIESLAPQAGTLKSRLNKAKIELASAEAGRNTALEERKKAGATLNTAREARDSLQTACQTARELSTLYSNYGTEFNNHLKTERGLASLGTALRSIIENTSSLQSAHEQASREQGKASSALELKAKSLTESQNERSAAETILTALQDLRNACDESGAALEERGSRLSEMEHDLSEMKSAAERNLAGRTFTTDGREKVTLNETITSARKNMTYDERGMLTGYQEVSNTGTGLTTTLDVSDQTYDASGRMTGQIIRSSEVRRNGKDEYTRKIETATSGMVYDRLGNLSEYEKTTKETLPSGTEKTVIEKTAGPNLYDEKGRLNLSKTAVTERTADAYERSYENISRIDAYNVLGQVSRQTRTAIDGDIATVETSLADQQYDAAGKLTYSKIRVIETSRDELNDALRSPSNFSQRTVETYGQTYDVRDQLTHTIRITNSGAKITVESSDLEYDAQGLLSSSRIKETSMGAGTYVSQSVESSGFKYNAAGQILQLTKHTIADGKETVETSLEDMRYDALNRLTYSNNKVTETSNGFFKETTAALKVLKYDAMNRIAREERTTIDGTKKIVESNACTEDFIYDGSQRLERQVFDVTETSVDPAEDLDKSYRSEQEFKAYDDFGRVTDSVQTITRTDSLTGGISIIEETSSKHYDSNGSVDENVAARRQIEEDGSGTILSDKTATTITLASAYNDAGQMTSFRTIAFEGDSLELRRDGHTESSTWNSLNEEEKKGILSGSIKDRLESTVTVTETDQAAYTIKGLMESWVSTTHAMGPADVDQTSIVLDHRFLNIRVRTSFNSLGQATDYDEISVDGSFLVLNGKIAAPSIIHSASDIVNLLPSLLTTWTRMSGLRYSVDGDAESYTQTKREIQVKEGELSVNRIQTVQRLETVRNGTGQETAICEEQTDASGRSVTVWTFFQYDPEGRATDLLQLTEDAGEWNAELTHVDRFVRLQDRDLYGRTRVTKNSSVDIADTLQDLRTGRLEAFMKDSGEGIFGKTSTAFSLTEQSRTSTEVSDFLYDGSAFPPRISAATVSRISEDGARSAEKTEYFYGADGDSKPSSTRTTRILDPEFDRNGVWKPSGTDLKTVEDAILAYNAQGLLSESRAVRVNEAGILSAENTDFTYEAGNVSATHKELISDLSGDMRIDLVNGIRAYSGGGQTAAEDTLMKYGDRNGNVTAGGKFVVETRVLTVDPLGRIQAELNRFQYEKAGRVSRSLNVTVEGLTMKADLSDFDFSNSGTARVTTIRDQYLYITEGNAAGLAASYRETIQDSLSPSRITVRNVGDIRYDPIRRLVSSRTEENETHLSDPTSSRIITIEAGIQGENAAAYDGYGRLANLTRITEESGIRTTEMIRHTFASTDGRVTSSLISTLRKDAETDGSILNSEKIQHITYLGFDPVFNKIADQRIETFEGGKRTTEEVHNTYDPLGRIAEARTLQSETCIDDARRLNRTVFTVTKAASFDDLGRMTDYIRTSTEGGKETTETVSEIVYDQADRITSSRTEIEEKDTAAGGTTYSTKNTQSLVQTYDGLGRVQSYRRTTLQGTEKQQTVESADTIRYDVEGRLIHQESRFRETDTSDQPGDVCDRTYSIVTDHQSFNSLGQADAWTRTTTEKEKQVTETAESVSYDASGRISASTTRVHERGTLSGVEVLDHSYTVDTSFEYNGLGQIVRSIRNTFDGEKSTSEVSKSLIYAMNGVLGESIYEITELDQTRTVRTKNTFDEYGRISSTLRTASSESGNHVSEEKIYDISYTKDGQMTGNIQDTEESSPGFCRKERVFTQGMVYNGLNQVMAYQRTTQALDASGGVKKETVETSADLTYDKKGLLVSSESDILDSSSLSHVKTQTLETNGLGQTIRYQKTTEIKDAGSGEIVKTIFERTLSDQTYDSRGRLLSSDIEYRELGTLSGVEVLDHTTRIQTQDLRYAASGLIAGYTRITDDGEKRVEESIEGDIAYDKEGRVITQSSRFTETDLQNNSLDHSYKILTQNLSFDKLDRVLKVRQTTIDGTRITETVTRGMAYDKEDRLLSYERTTRDGDLVTREKNLENNVYDALGRLVKSNVRITDESADGKALSISRDVSTRNTKYDTHNRVLQYERVTTDPAKTTVEETSEDLLYNALGQTVYSNINYHENAEGLDRSYSIKTENTKFNGQGLASRFTRTTVDGARTTQETTAADQTYDASGRVFASSIKVRERGTLSGTGALDHSYENNILETVYNGLGQIIYQARERKEFGKTVTENLSDFKYDSLGRNTASRSAVHEIGNIFSLDRRYQKETSVSNYNRLGQALDTVTIITKDDAAPDRKTLSEQKNTVYNKKGQVTSCTEISRSNTSPDRIQTVTREDMQYNALGQASSWNETQSYGTPGSEIHSRVTGTVYDTEGRLAEKIETKTWKAVGGGNIAGLDSGWMNGSATVSTSYGYEAGADRLEGQGVKAVGNGSHPNGWGNFDNLFAEGDIRYDTAGRQIESTTLVTAPLKYTYRFYERKGLGQGVVRDHQQENVTVDKVTTITHSRTLAFDALGRATEVNSEFVRDDRNSTQGWTRETGIAYDANGQKSSSRTEGRTSIRACEEEDPRSGGLVSDATKDIANNVNTAGALLCESKNLPVNWTERVKNAWWGERTVAIDSRSTNGYVYDAYGNIDDNATQKETRTEQTSTISGVSNADWIKTADIAFQIIDVLSMVISIACPPAGIIASIFQIGFKALQASIHSESIEKAAGRAAVNTAVQVLTSSVKMLADAAAVKMVGTGTNASAVISRGIVKTIISAGGYSLAHVGASYANGQRSEGDYWKSAGSGAIAGGIVGISSSIEVSGNVSRAVKVLLITGLNVAAARVDGIKDGKQLLTIAAISASTNLIQSYIPKKEEIEKRTSLQAANQAVLGVILAKVSSQIILNNANSMEDRVFASAVAQLAANTVSALAASKAKSSYLLKNFIPDSQAFQQTLMTNILQESQNEAASRPQTLEYGKGARSVEEVQAERSDNIREQSAYFGALLDSSLQLASSVNSLTVFVLAGTLKDIFSQATSAVISSTEKSVGDSIIDEGTSEAISAIAKTAADIQNMPPEQIKDSLLCVEGLNITQIENGRIDCTVDGKAISLKLGKNGIESFSFKDNFGQDVTCRFDSFQYDRNGQVLVAQGIIKKEDGSETGFTYAAKGSKEFEKTVQSVKERISGGEARSKIAQADSVYADSSGRTVWMRKENGKNMVLASEHRDTDGSSRLMTYSHSKDGSITGNIYELKKGEKQYSDKPAGKFEIKELNGRIYCTETTDTDRGIVRKEAVINKSSGLLEEFRLNGQEQTLSDDGRKSLFESMPVLYSSDPAILVEKTAEVQEQLMRSAIEQKRAAHAADPVQALHSSDRRLQETDKKIEKYPQVKKIIDAVGNKAGMGMENLGARPAVFLAAAVITLVQAVYDMVVAIYCIAKSFDGNTDRLKAQLQTVVQKFQEASLLVSKALASIGGYVLSFTPAKDLSEHLDNWGLKGVWLNDRSLKIQCRPDENASILVVMGITNNFFRKTTFGEGNLNFREARRKELTDYIEKLPPEKMSAEQKKAALQTIDKIDFAAAYTGNYVADAIFSVFEKNGWSIVSRKMFDGYQDHQYKMVYAHSGGGAIFLNRQSDIKTENLTLIGAEGACNGWYHEVRSVERRNIRIISFKNDPIPYLSLENQPSGLRISFGVGGADVREAPVTNGFWDISGNHDVYGYLTADMQKIVKLLSVR